VAELGAVTRLIEERYPLPRCRHGRALRDHAGEALVCPDGCTQPENGVELHAPIERRLRDALSKAP
jgi:hypothetical protein